MSIARIIPRPSLALRRMTVDHYCPHMAGFYRGARDTWLIAAKAACDSELRSLYAGYAKDEHRSLMRVLREYRREQRLNREAA